jgi:hypothetical protein
VQQPAQAAQVVAQPVAKPVVVAAPAPQQQQVQKSAVAAPAQPALAQAPVTAPAKQPAKPAPIKSNMQASLKAKMAAALKAKLHSKSMNLKPVKLSQVKESADLEKLWHEMVPKEMLYKLKATQDSL